MTALALLLFFWPWGNDLWALPKIVAVCACLGWWGATRRDVFRPAAWGPWLAVFAAVLTSTLFSYDLGNSLFGVPNPMGLGLLGWVVCALCFLQGFGSARSQVEPFVVWGSLVMAALAFVLPKSFAYTRAVSTQGSPVFLGFMLVLATPLVWRRWPWLVALLFGAAWLAKSHAAELAIPVVVFFLYLKERRSHEIALD